jgi:hypothetical protein
MVWKTVLLIAKKPFQSDLKTNIKLDGNEAEM